MSNTGSPKSAAIKCVIADSSEPADGVAHIPVLRRVSNLGVEELAAEISKAGVFVVSGDAIVGKRGHSE